MMPHVFPVPMRIRNLHELTHMTQMTQMEPASHVQTFLRNPLGPEPLTRTSWRAEAEVVDGVEVKVEVEADEGV